MTEGIGSALKRSVLVSLIQTEGAASKFALTTPLMEAVQKPISSCVSSNSFFNWRGSLEFQQSEAAYACGDAHPGKPCVA
jgi:hypothetical protein